MPCPVTHTTSKGEMKKAEFKLPKDGVNSGSYLKWCVLAV